MAAREMAINYGVKVRSYQTVLYIVEDGEYVQPLGSGIHLPLENGVILSEVVRFWSVRSSAHIILCLAVFECIVAVVQCVYHNIPSVVYSVNIICCRGKFFGMEGLTFPRTFARHPNFLFFDSLEDHC